jgi:dihydrofolate synthase/folylpolyglutamate synthase
MLSYRDALTYVYGFTDYEKRGFAVYAPEFYNLDRVRRLLSLLGEPQRSFQAIHIAGTKGKGSTAAMVESVLRVAGFRTGLYTSPHLHTFRERIQTCGDLIPEADVARLVDEMKPLVAQVADITTFEIVTVLAFAWFAQQGVEWAVVEVGLGGRLDATNVLTPAVAVITSISYDHTAILGETLALIAGEKLGIVKPGVPVVSAPQSAEALAVIEETCSHRGAPLTLVSRDWRWELDAANLDGQAFALVGGQRVIDELWIPLLGQHQVVNAATAVAALSLLRRAGIDLSQTAIRDGLRAVHWPGRLEILGQAPLVVADGAHNGDSAQKLVAALRDHCDYRRLVVVWGASADHATPELMEALLSGADRAIAIRSRHPRAADPSWLQARAAELGFCLEVKETVAQALTVALDDAETEDLICCTGSVFVAAEAREAWFARQGMALPPSDPA